MLRANTIIETGKITFKKGDEIPDKTFKAPELKQLIKDGVILDVEEDKLRIDSEGSAKVEYTGSDESDADNGDSKNDLPPTGGKQATTSEE